VTIRTHTPSDLSAATQSRFPAHTIEFESRWIVGTRVDAGTYDSTIDLICERTLSISLEEGLIETYR
jgi:hypothetical protein